MEIMHALNLPSFEFDIKKVDDDSFTIFDTIRKKYVVLTPEEWVRQNFVRYIVNHLHYSKNLIRLEGGMAYNTLKKRTDVLVYNRRGEAYILVECKAPHINIEEKVFKQASVYNKTVKAKYLVVTNGLKHYCCEIDHLNNAYKFLDHLPEFTDESTGLSDQ